MKGFYKRVLCLFVALVLVVGQFGCNDIKDKKFKAYKEGLSVNFINVGNGDCIYLSLPDGKNMLIDTGENINDNYLYVKEILNAYSVEEIDYFVLTHPDVDHVGNATNIAQDYKIKRAFVPRIENDVLYKNFKNIVNKLEQVGASIEYSRPLLNLSTSDYKICFLSPCGTSDIDSYYGEFNSTKIPTGEQENDLSPIIYLEYLSVRFLFTGDAGTRQEELLISGYQSGVYTLMPDQININDIDVLKVSHHGSKNSTGDTLLATLKPKLSIFSVSADSSYEMPSTETINRIIKYSPNGEIARTDIDGTITVNVQKQGKMDVYKQ